MTVANEDVRVSMSNEYPARKGYGIRVAAVIVGLLMVVPVAAVIMAIPNSGQPLKASASESPGLDGQRSVFYRWYDMFNVPFGDWWNYRMSGETIYSDTYPYIFEYDRGGGDTGFYANQRLSVNAFNITEISMNSMSASNHPFLPHWGISSGGNATLDWYMQYMTRAEVDARYPGSYIASLYDGWYAYLNGTILMDEQAAKGVLGISAAEFQNFGNWWASSNGKSLIQSNWQSWLNSEASDQHYWIMPTYMTDMMQLDININAVKIGDKIQLSLYDLSWGIETLLTRWLHATFMPTEWYFEDFNMHMVIGPEAANAYIDTAVVYALRASETTEVPAGQPKGDPCWVWEGMLGDCLPTPSHILVPSAEHAYNDFANYSSETSLSKSPGSLWYHSQAPYVYTPGAFNLLANESMTFEWPAANMTFFEGTGVGTYLSWDEPMKVAYGEPFPDDEFNITSGGSISIDQTNRILTYSGPIDFYAWSKDQTSYEDLSSEWSRLGGNLLPRGCPYIEFRADTAPVPIPYRLEMTGLEYPLVVRDPVPVTVTCYDQYGSVYRTFDDTVQFSSTGHSASLPADYTFTPADNGSHTFEVSYTKPGNYTLNVQAALSTLNDSAQVLVLSAPEQIGSFAVECAGLQQAGDPFSLTVTAFNQFGARFTRYTGTVEFSSDAPIGSCTLPGAYAFTLSDAGSHTFSYAASFDLAGNFTLVAADQIVLTATGEATVMVVMAPHISYRMYDMFETPWREWWWQRSAYEVDIMLSNVPHAYTMLYNGYNDGLSGIIYAPYRWNVVASDLTTIDVDRPEFMPTFGPTDVPGAVADLQLHWDYINDTWWNDYWYPMWQANPGWNPGYNASIREMQKSDGYVVGVSYEVRMNREAALTWLGLPLSEDALDWWTLNQDTYVSDWGAWIRDEGNNRLDIYAGYWDIYYDLGTMCDLLEQPNGDLLLRVGHFSWGYEVLQTRWLTEARICANEPYMEDFWLSANYTSNSTYLTYDAVCQWSLHAVRANGTEDGAAWVWEPSKIDRIAELFHKSYYEPYQDLTYTDWNAGDPNWGTPLGPAGYPVYYEYTPTWFNLSYFQTLTFELPSGAVIGYKGVSTWVDTTTYTSSSIINATQGDLGDFDRITVNGEMSLGYWYSGGPDLGSMYDEYNKTLTVEGPLSFDNIRHWPDGPLYHGAPWIEFNVTPLGPLPPMPPVVGPLSDVFCEVGEAVSFNVSASDPNGDSMNFTWHFGDGSQGSGNPVAHTYSSAGNYTVFVIVTDSTGLNASSGAIAYVTAAPPTGYLRVTTSPALPSMISVDGYWRTTWGVDWLPFEPGPHYVSFGDVLGYMKPAPQMVTVYPGETTYVQGDFIQMAYLTVNTSPVVHSTISVNGIPRNDASLHLYVAPGSYTITWGDVAGYTPPSPVVNLSLVSGGSAEITGVFVSNPTAQGPDPASFGYLRVQSSPAVPTMIFVDGEAMNTWGLDWVKVTPGSHMIFFSSLQGYSTPGLRNVTVPAGAIGSTIGYFTALPTLKVTTNPSRPGVISVDGIPRDTWGLYEQVPLGTYTISFGPVRGHIAPDSVIVEVVAGLNNVMGVYIADTPAATYSRSPITNGVILTVVSITKSDVSWDDIDVRLSNGTNSVGWGPWASDLTGNNSKNLTTRSLDSLVICCWAWDLTGNGIVNHGDFVTVFTYGGAPTFSSTTTYTLSLYYKPTWQMIGAGLVFTG